METLSTVIAFIFSFKAYVMLPAVILLVALAIRMKVGQSLMSALRLGVGFAGIFVAFDFFVQQIAPAVTALVEKRTLRTALAPSSFAWAIIRDTASRRASVRSSV